MAHLPQQALLELHDGPYAGLTQLSRVEHGGREGLRIQAGEWCIDVEVVEIGPGTVVPSTPRSSIGSHATRMLSARLR